MNFKITLLIMSIIISAQLYSQNFDNIKSNYSPEEISYFRTTVFTGTFDLNKTKPTQNIIKRYENNFITIGFDKAPLSGSLKNIVKSIISDLNDALKNSELKIKYSKLDADIKISYNKNIWNKTIYCGSRNTDFPVKLFISNKLTEAQNYNFINRSIFQILGISRYQTINKNSISYLYNDIDSNYINNIQKLKNIDKKMLKLLYEPLMHTGLTLNKFDSIFYKELNQYKLKAYKNIISSFSKTEIKYALSNLFSKNKLLDKYNKPFTVCIVNMKSGKNKVSKKLENIISKFNKYAPNFKIKQSLKNPTLSIKITDIKKNIKTINDGLIILNKTIYVSSYKNIESNILRNLGINGNSVEDFKMLNLLYSKELHVGMSKYEFKWIFNEMLK